MNLTAHVARVGDYQIQYRAGGQRGAPTVVMLHGGGGYRHDARFVDGLATRFQVIAPSMPGFDDSSPGTVGDVRDVADVMADFIRVVVDGPTTVLGGARPPFDPELFDQLAHVRAPTLVLWGTADGMIAPASASHFVGRIPNARLISLENAPHVLAAAVPDQVLAAVFDFVSETQTEATSRAAV